MVEYLISADDLLRLATLAVSLEQDHGTADEVMSIIHRTPVANSPASDEPAAANPIPPAKPE